MKNLNNKRFVIFSSVLTIVLILLDQTAKTWAVNRLQGKEPIAVIKNIFEFHYLEGGNTGGAWGVFSGKMNFFIILTLIVIIVIAYLFLKVNKGLITNVLSPVTRRKFRVLQIVFVLLISGALGNLIDRIRLNYVIDFLYFKPINFPIFNVADTYVSLAAMGLFILGLFVMKEDELNLIFPSNKKSKGDSKNVQQ